MGAELRKLVWLVIGRRLDATVRVAPAYDVNDLVNLAL